MQIIAFFNHNDELTIHKPSQIKKLIAIALNKSQSIHVGI